MTPKYYKNFENFLKFLKLQRWFPIINASKKKYILYLCEGGIIPKKNILYLYEDRILPNNPTRLLPIGDPPPGGFRFSPIARDFTH